MKEILGPTNLFQPEQPCEPLAHLLFASGDGANEALAAAAAATAARPAGGG